PRQAAAAGGPVQACPEQPAGGAPACGWRPSPARRGEANVANLSKRVPEDQPGDFFVDSTCIDCDTYRQLAHAVFADAPDPASSRAQPRTADDRRSALQALVCCPTGSIGSQGGDRPSTVLGDFPLEVEAPVFYCGFNSPKSFGGNSYFVRHPAG